MSKMIALFFLVAAWTVADAAISEIEVKKSQDDIWIQFLKRCV